MSKCPLPLCLVGCVVPVTSCGSEKKGGDPKTDPRVRSSDNLQSGIQGGDPKNDPRVRSSDNYVQIDDSVSPRKVELASQIATTVSPASPELLPALVSRADVDPELSEGCTIEKGAESPDALTVSGELRSCVRVEGSLLGRLLERRFMNPISDCSSTSFSRSFHDGKRSDDLRQSDFGVQKLPASASSSELSSHQMGESLACPTGRERVDGHPPESLSLQDRALLRRYSKVFCDEVVRNKSDGLRQEEMNLRGQPIVLRRRHPVLRHLQKQSLRRFPLQLLFLLPKTIWPMVKEHDRKMESERGDGTREKR